MSTYDVIVIGGGPAGSRAGETAAAAGAETIVLEKGVPRADREGLGPDSTDAAGMLDYWVDILDIPYEEIPSDIVLRELRGSEFIGPTERCQLFTTGIDATYDGFGFTFHRAKMDDWLRQRAEESGAEYRVGTAVTTIDSELGDGHRHTVTLADGTELESEYLICADGPQRTVTLNLLDSFLPDHQPISGILGPRVANHVAYQEYRQIPEEVYEEDMLKFWWGYIPGETAYPWIFPNDGPVARVGLTMPMALDLDTIANKEHYALIQPDDTDIPAGGELIRRLLEHEYGDVYDIEADFPLVEDRGKRGGTEAYAISSTRPIDSPTAAGVAIVGGAMGTTSAFHEGGYHVAGRTGAIAGELAATGELGRYNAAWKRAIGDEILRNVSFADIVADYEPDDWDEAFRIARRMIRNGRSADDQLIRRQFTAGVGAAKLSLQYRKAKFRYRKGRYVQLTEDEYQYD